MPKKDQQPQDDSVISEPEGTEADQLSFEGNPMGDGDIEEILNFDPFADEPDTAGDDAASAEQPEGGDQAQEESGNSEPDSSGQVQPGIEDSADGAEGQQGEGQNDGQQAVQQSEDSELAQLRDLVKQQGQMLQQLQAQRVQAPSQNQRGDGSSEAANADLAQMYSLQVPQQIMQGMMSEDAGEMQTAMQQLIQGIGATIHGNLRKELNETISSQVPQMISSQASQTSEREQIYNDFYGKYPQLDKDELRPLVQSVAGQVSSEIGASQWSPQLRDMVAQRVIAAIGGVVSNGQGQSQPKAPAKKQSWQSNGSSPRAPQGPSNPNSSRSISDTLGF